MLKQRTTFLGALSFHKLDVLLNSFIDNSSPKGRSNFKKLGVTLESRERSDQSDGADTN